MNVVVDYSPRSDASGSTSSTLIDRVKADDPASWQRILDIHGPLIYRWCRESGLQAADAADIAQEVFAVLTQKIKDFRRDRPGDSFRAWLKTITLNKVRDFFRRSGREPKAAGGTEAQHRLAQFAGPEPAGSTTDVNASDDPGLENQAMQMVHARVEDRTWQAFWRVTVDGQRVADVAADLGMSVTAVYKAKYRVIREIRDELADLND